jgi:hypothetical protein
MSKHTQAREKKSATGPVRYADPNCRITRIFQVIESLTQIESSARPDQDLVATVLEVLKIVSKLLSLNFWNSLQYLPEMPQHLIPDSDSLRSRREMLHAHMLQLRSNSVSTADVTGALDFASDVIDRLKKEFSLGTMPEDQPIHDDARYFCAAMIPALAQQFEEVWSARRDD